MTSISARRLSKELNEINRDGCPIGITLLQADDFSKWLLSIQVMGDSLYMVLSSFSYHFLSSFFQG